MIPTPNARFHQATEPPRTIDLSKLVKSGVVVEKSERVGYEWIGAGRDALRKAMAVEETQSRDVINGAG